MIKVTKVRVVTNLYLAVTMAQKDHVMSRVVIALVRDLIIRRGTAVMVLVKAGITIMVLIMNRVDIEGDCDPQYYSGPHNQDGPQYDNDGPPPHRYGPHHYQYNSKPRYFQEPPQEEDPNTSLTVDIVKLLLQSVGLRN